MNENKIELSGRVMNEWELDHEYAGEKFYTAILQVRRSSGNVDELPIVISEFLINPSFDLTGVTVFISGNIKTYNVHDGNNRHLKVFTFVNEFQIIDDFDGDNIDTNYVELEGFICKKDDEPRTTPLHKIILDCIIANNNAYNKSYYIPTIFWGRNAESAAKLPIGTKVRIRGRMQSRIYKETNVAYELSVQSYEIIED